MRAWLQARCGGRLRRRTAVLLALALWLAGSGLAVLFAEPSSAEAPECPENMVAATINGFGDGCAGTGEGGLLILEEGFSPGMQAIVYFPTMDQALLFQSQSPGTIGCTDYTALAVCGITSPGSYTVGVDGIVGVAAELIDLVSFTGAPEIASWIDEMGAIELYVDPSTTSTTTTSTTGPETTTTTAPGDPPPFQYESASSWPLWIGGSWFAGLFSAAVLRLFSIRGGR